METGYVDMLNFNGYDEPAEAVNKSGQSHVFTDWEKLGEKEKSGLMTELSEIDFDFVKKLFALTREKNGSAVEFDPAPYIPVPRIDNELKYQNEAKHA